MLVAFLLSSTSEINLGLFFCFPTCCYSFLSFFMHLPFHVTFEFTIYNVLGRLDACSLSLVLLKPLFPSSLVCISLALPWFISLVSAGAACTLTPVILCSSTLQPVSLLFKVPVIPGLYSSALCVNHKYFVPHRISTCFY